jgi:hypothetical protein
MAVMVSAGIGALLLLVQHVAPSVELLTEAGAGNAPLVAGTTPQTGWMATVQPAGQLRVGAGDTFLLARYSPRLTWRHPNQEKDTLRPLLLHVASLSGAYAPSAPWLFTMSLDTTAGEADYATLNQVLGQTQAGQTQTTPQAQSALPQQQRIFTGLVSTSAARSLDARTAVGLRLDFHHRRPLDAPMAMPPSMGTPVPAPSLTLARQTAISGGPFLIWYATMRNQLETLVDLTYETREPDITFFIGYSTVAWTHKLSLDETLLITAGAGYITVDMKDMTTGLPDKSSSVSPVATVRYSGIMTKSGEFQVASNLGLGVEAMVDPVLNAAGPRGTAQGELAVRLSQPWEVAADGNFTTSLRRHPLDTGPGSGPALETVVMAVLRLRHHLTREISLDARARWSNRAPHLRADDFAFKQRELWFSLGLTYISRPAGGS